MAAATEAILKKHQRLLCLHSKADRIRESDFSLAAIFDAALKKIMALAYRAERLAKDDDHTSRCSRLHCQPNSSCKYPNAHHEPTGARAVSQASFPTTTLVNG